MGLPDRFLCLSLIPPSLELYGGTSPKSGNTPHKSRDKRKRGAKEGQQGKAIRLGKNFGRSKGNWRLSAFKVDAGSGHEWPQETTDGFSPHRCLAATFALGKANAYRTDQCPVGPCISCGLRARRTGDCQRSVTAQVPTAAGSRAARTRPRPGSVVARAPSTTRRLPHLELGVIASHGENSAGWVAVRAVRVAGQPKCWNHRPPPTIRRGSGTASPEFLPTAYPPTSFR